MAAHAYWRINVTAITGGGGAGGTTLGTVEFHTSIGGAQAATGGTAIESSHIASFVPANAFDTNATSYWASGVLGAGQYIGYHFASAVDIVEVALTVFTGAARTDDPKNFTVDWSDDGSAWTPLMAANDQTWTSGQTKTFSTDGTPALRASQVVIETIGDATPALRGSQVVAEVLSDGTPALRASQMVFELLGSNTPTALLETQAAIEVASSTSEIPSNARLAQEVIEVASSVPVSINVTQVVRLSLIAVQSTARVTSVIRLTLAVFFAAVRVTTVARLVLAEAVPCLTFWATMWWLRRRDGRVFAFTSHDNDLVFRADTFKTCASLQASATEQGAMLGDIGNMEIMGLITDDSITEADLFAGLFDGAELEVWLFPWAGDETPRRLIAGETGNLSQRVGGFTMEILTASQRLQQKAVVEMVTPTCRYDLGDDRCKIDLEALRQAGSVTGLAAINAHNQANKRIFFDTSRTEESGYWDVGTITFDSGDNDGLSAEVKSFDQATGEFVLWEPLQYPIAIGDSYTIVPGCFKTKTACQEKFDNYINFGGFPDVPGGDAISQTPNAGGGGNVQG